MSRSKKIKSKRITLARSGQKKSRKSFFNRQNLKFILIVAIVLFSFVTISVVFIILERFAGQKTKVSQSSLVPKIIDAPDWISDSLKEKTIIAAQMGIQDEPDIKKAAEASQQNITSAISWLEKVSVQITHENILISGSWRKPIGLLKSGLKTFYIDKNMYIMDYIESPKLNTVRIDGLRFVTSLRSGKLWQADDAAAAIELLVRLDKMDTSLFPDKPLLAEIESIDMSNYNGRENTNAPHIILYTKDKTEIIWGAETGTWQRHLEATDEEKLTNLYAYYKEYGTLIGGAKYINLQYSQQQLTLPVDKY
jgi:hypothetical protein